MEKGVGSGEARALFFPRKPRGSRGYSKRLLALVSRYINLGTPFIMRTPSSYHASNNHGTRTDAGNEQYKYAQ